MSFDALAAMPQSEKERLLLENFTELTEHHRAHCRAYDRPLTVTGVNGAARSLDEIPYLPVGIFKSHRLVRVPQSSIFKTMTSSGTTGQQVNQIFIDKETAMRQTHALGRIDHVLGASRLPMIMVETSTLITDRKRFKARAPRMLGPAKLGGNHLDASDEKMKLDEPGDRRLDEATLNAHGHTDYGHHLSSVPQSSIFNPITASDAACQQVSRISVDKETAMRQPDTLAPIPPHDFDGPDEAMKLDEAGNPQLFSEYGRQLAGKLNANGKVDYSRLEGSL